jgi:hypothetical protein
MYPVRAAAAMPAVDPEIARAVGAFVRVQLDTAIQRGKTARTIQRSDKQATDRWAKGALADLEATFGDLPERDARDRLSRMFLDALFLLIESNAVDRDALLQQDRFLAQLLLGEDDLKACARGIMWSFVKCRYGMRSQAEDAQLRAVGVEHVPSFYDRMADRKALKEIFDSADMRVLTDRMRAGARAEVTLAAHVLDKEGRKAVTRNELAAFVLEDNSVKKGDFPSWTAIRASLDKVIGSWKKYAPVVFPDSRSGRPVEETPSGAAEEDGMEMETGDAGPAPRIPEPPSPIEDHEVATQDSPVPSEGDEATTPDSPDPFEQFYARRGQDDEVRATGAMTPETPAPSVGRESSSPRAVDPFEEYDTAPADDSKRPVSTETPVAVDPFEDYDTGPEDDRMPAGMPVELDTFRLDDESSGDEEDVVMQTTEDTATPKRGRAEQPPGQMASTLDQALGDAPYVMFDMRNKTEMPPKKRRKSRTQGAILDAVSQIKKLRRMNKKKK